MHGKREQEEYIRKGPWEAEEAEVLLNHVKKYGPRDWSSIRSKGLLQRTGKSCHLRWVNKLQPNLKNGKKMHGEREQEEYIRKGPWKAEEDEVLLNHVKNYGPKDWSSIRSKGLLQRTCKSCRLHWVNKLQPNLKK